MAVRVAIGVEIVLKNMGGLKYWKGTVELEMEGGPSFALNFCTEFCATKWKLLHCATKIGDWVN